jgi:hypothetical protein
MCVVATVASGQPTSIATQHDNNARTGANVRETVLTPQTVNSQQFGKLYELPVLGQVYAQPLYLSRVGFPDGTTRNLLIVATMRNQVYAFDADDSRGSVLWRVQLGKPVPYNFMPMSYSTSILGIIPRQHPPTNPRSVEDGGRYNIYPYIGITSTPVADTVNNTLYVVAKTLNEERGIDYKLHALDLVAGTERAHSPVAITASIGKTSFSPARHLQRPALLLVNNRVVIAFGSHQDTPPYHGWILSYDGRTLTQLGKFCTTPTGERGGVWQAGNGLAADDDGNVYAMVGDGTFDADAGGANVGESFIKLDAFLRLIGRVTPRNWKTLNRSDADLGSAGPLLIGSHLMLGAGKEGRLYLIDRARMTVATRPAVNGTGSPSPEALLQTFQAAARPDVINLSGVGYHHVHGSPVMWSSSRVGTLIYLWAERDRLRAFRLDTTASHLDTVPLLTSSVKSPPHSMPGGFLTISADGGKTGSGILWASLPARGDALTKVVPGVLRAFDAEDLHRELWNSQQISARDDVGFFAKYVAPTVANGKVYLATFSDRINVYGLLR